MNIEEESADRELCIKSPIFDDSSKRVEWMKGLFKMIVDKCKEKEISNFMITIEYSGEDRHKDGHIVPHNDTWSLHDIKGFLAYHEEN